MIIVDVLFLLLIGILIYLLMARKAGIIGSYVLRFLGCKVHEYNKEDEHSGSKGSR